MERSFKNKKPNKNKEKFFEMEMKNISKSSLNVFCPTFIMICQVFPKTTNNVFIFATAADPGHFCPDKVPLFKHGCTDN